MWHVYDYGNGVVVMQWTFSHLMLHSVNALNYLISCVNYNVRGGGHVTPAVYLPSDVVYDMIFSGDICCFGCGMGSFPGCIWSYNVYARTDDVHTLVPDFSYTSTRASLCFGRPLSIFYTDKYSFFVFCT